MAKHVTNQHYVPELLLRYFADSEKNIYYYDKQWKRIENKGVGGVAFEKYFYDRKPGFKEGSLEYTYQRAETHTAPIIQKIVSQNSLTNITLDEKVTLAMFIVMQLNRTKTALSNTERLQKELWDGIKKFADSSEIEFEEKATPAKDLWFSILENTPRLTEILMQKIWYLAYSNNEFYTSDHPVVKGNYKNKDISHIRGVLGLDSDGIEIYFPLTPSLLLCMLCQRSYAQPNEEVVQYQAQNIEYVNHLQVKESERFIFADPKNDFLLVKDIMQKGDL